MAAKYIHLEKATDKGIPDIRKMYIRHQPMKTILKEQYKQERDKHIFNPLFILDELVEMNRSDDHKITGTVLEKGKFVEKPIVWAKLTSRRFPGVKIISYKIGEGDGHRVVLFNRGGEVNYYNSTGEKLSDLPPELVASIGVGVPLSDVKNSKHIHQMGADTCAYHSTLRSCYKHLSDDEYNDMITKRANELKINTDQLAYSKGLLTSEKKKITETDEPPISMKKGGLLRKGEKSVPVPIIAHSGELVVPVDTVDDVLNSNAWKKHVKRISLAKNVSFNEAYKISLGL